MKQLKCLKILIQDLCNKIVREFSHKTADGKETKYMDYKCSLSLIFNNNNKRYKMNEILIVGYILGSFFMLLMLFYLSLCMLDYLARKIDNYNYNKKRSKK